MRMEHIKDLPPLIREVCCQWMKHETKTMTRIGCCIVEEDDEDELINVHSLHWELQLIRQWYADYAFAADAAILERFDVAIEWSRPEVYEKVG